MKTLDQYPYTYKGFHESKGHCHLEIYERGEDDRHAILVVMTEMETNNGPSVTTCAETIATQVVQRYTLPLSRTLWFEHYPARPHVHGEIYSLVTFEWMEDQQAIRARFTPISAELAEGLIAAFNKG